MLSFFVVAFTLVSSAQEDKSKRPSPPAQATASVDGTDVTIDYSQPSLKNRDINKLAPVGQIWRTGANEASWVEFSDDVKIDGKVLKKGKYGLFTINNKTEWTIIFNEVWKQWGHYSYDSSKDALRVDVTPKTSDSSVEKFTIKIEESGDVTLNWGNTVVPFKISK
ncbi:MAG: DUF2911 domain-containing protein [Cyclobacteriaceae bacterium]